MSVARVLVDFLAPRFAFLLQLFDRLPDAAQQLEDDRRRDVGHDAQAEDRGLAQVAGAEHGRVFDQLAEATWPDPQAASTLVGSMIGSGICQPMR